MTGYDVDRLTPGGVVVTHHDGPITTEPSWLLLNGDTAQQVVAAYPCHAVVSVEACQGRCGRGGS